MTLRLALATLAVALILPLTGCDESGGMSTDATTVIADAQIARQHGDFDRAEALLRGALQQDAASAPVRAELAATLMARQGLNLLDLDRIAQFVIDGTNAAATAPAGRPAGTCSFAGTGTPFDPTTVSGFPQITASGAQIEEAISLMAPLLPAGLTSFDACTEIAADGSLVYDRAGATAQLRASGLTDAQISQMLANNALARFLSAYLTVSTGLNQQTTWYRMPNGSVGICADDTDALVAQTRPAVARLGTAVLSLDTRARSFGGTTDLVDAATSAFADIREGIAGFCAAL